MLAKPLKTAVSWNPSILRITMNKYLTQCQSGAYVSDVQSNKIKYEGWNFNSGNYLFTTDTK